MPLLSHGHADATIASTHTSIDACSGMHFDVIFILKSQFHGRVPLYTHVDAAPATTCNVSEHPLSHAHVDALLASSSHYLD